MIKFKWDLEVATFFVCLVSAIASTTMLMAVERLRRERVAQELALAQLTSRVEALELERNHGKEQRNQ